MKRWTNGLPGATKRLGANLALRGLSVSQSGCARIPMMARSKIAPLQRPNNIDAALTFVGLGTPSCNARPGHTFWHFSDLPRESAIGRSWGQSGPQQIAEQSLFVSTRPVRPRADLFDRSCFYRLT